MRALRIILLTGSARGAARGFLAGIARYSSLHGPWTFYREPHGYFGRDVETKTTDLRAWRPHAAVCPTSRLELIRRLRIPIVAVEYDYPRSIPGVVADDAKLGRLAAEHLLSLGFDRFAFCGFEFATWSRERCSAFSGRIEEAGHTVDVFRPKFRQPIRWVEEEPQLIAWLTSLPKPIGLCCANDDRATHVLESCGDLGYGVPEDIAVIGIDNDPYICELSNPPLTSVALATERAGYEAAELLHRLILGEAKMEGQRIVTRAAGVVARQSTDILMVRDADVRAALRFMRENIGQPIQVKDIVKATNLSHRTLNSRFYRECGSSIVRQLTNARITYIARLLRETSLSIGEIARMSGFDSDRHFARYFRAEMDQTPNEYRRKFSAAPLDGSTGDLQSNAEAIA